MAISITPTTNVSPAGVPRVKLVVAWTTGPVPASVTIYRKDPDGSRRTVRQGDPLILSAGAGTAYDYEAAFDSSVSYVVSNGTTEASSGAVTLTSGGVPWLVHAGLPELSTPLLVADWPTWTRPIVRGVFQPIGRKFPIAVTSRQRSGESGDLSVYTLSAADHDALLKVLADGTPLLLKGTSREFAGTRWVSVGDLVESPSTETDLRTLTTWTLPLLAVEAPAGQALAAVTYADASAVFLSYADAQGKAATFADRSAGLWR